MIGQTISHYRITEKLGEGGMGVVYKAEDNKLKRPVALKFLAAHLLNDGKLKARFRREAEAAAALSHPNICTVHEIDEVEAKTFIAMAFIEGESLEKRVASGPLNLAAALDIAIQTAHGLQAAHEKKIVHRDIKPANLMITGSGAKRRVTVMDFGLAQLADRSKLTRADETMGTVGYMSPEQTRGLELDNRTDIWSLGVVLYEMVTGRQPFQGHYDKAVMYSITNEQPDPLTAVRTGVPMELEWIAGKCLAKDPEQRYQSTADLVIDLETLKTKLTSGKSTILHRSGAETGVGAGHAASAVPPPTTRAQTQHEETPSAEGEAGGQPGLVARPKLPWALFAVTVIALGALAVVHFRESPPRRPVRKFALTPENFQYREARPAISPNGKYIAYAAGAPRRASGYGPSSRKTRDGWKEPKAPPGPFGRPIASSSALSPAACSSACPPREALQSTSAGFRALDDTF